MLYIIAGLLFIIAALLFVLALNYVPHFRYLMGCAFNFSIIAIVCLIVLFLITEVLLYFYHNQPQWLIDFWPDKPSSFWMFLLYLANSVFVAVMIVGIIAKFFEKLKDRGFVSFFVFAVFYCLIVSVYLSFDSDSWVANLIFYGTIFPILPLTIYLFISGLFPRYFKIIKWPQ